MDSEKKFYKNSETSDALWDVAVSPENVSCLNYSGLRVASLDGIYDVDLPASNLERIIIPLNGEGFDVAYTVDGETHVQFLNGRESVMHGASDVLYLPVGAQAVLRGSSRVAVAEAAATNVKPVQFVSKDDIQIELRGSEYSSRQVHNFGMPNMIDADRLMVCEVITPSNNWSSFPPHKHDSYEKDVESNLEEIYYFEVEPTRSRKEDEDSVPESPIGYIRNYGLFDDSGEAFIKVASGDLALVPDGWHGPAIAGDGYDLYYLNVMSGPDPERVWLATDEPNFEWIRETWTYGNFDPRLPYGA